VQGQGPPPSYHSVVTGEADEDGGPAASHWGPSNPIGPRGSGPPPPLEDPPEYSVAASLPSYEQSELQKEKLYDSGPDLESGECSSPEAQPRRQAARRQRSCRNWETVDEDLALLGNDFVFFTAFVTSFLFNWVGFLLLMCFCHTIAARYGALAGFGLSLAKWTLIVQRSTDLVHEENAWLWWLVLGFGFLICIRACFQFRQIKRSWPHLSTSARERLFFFY